MSGMTGGKKSGMTEGKTLEMTGRGGGNDTFCHARRLLSGIQHYPFSSHPPAPGVRKDGFPLKPVPDVCYRGTCGNDGMLVDSDE